jgi:hypothetical protein
MWKQEEIDKAIELAKEGKTYNEIGEFLHKTGHSVKCKFLKIKIKLKDFREIKKYKIIKCLNCGCDVIGGDRKFCNTSCSAIFNNEKIHGILNKPKIRITYFCLNCNKELKGKNKTYCNNKCNGEYIRKLSIEKWKNGELKGIGISGKMNTYLREYLFQKFENKCFKCGWCEINEFTKKIPLEVEHIDGNSENNKEENLTLLCPNCHSLTSTYKGANRGNGRHNRMIRYRNGLSF